MCLKGDGHVPLRENGPVSVCEKNGCACAQVEASIPSFMDCMPFPFYRHVSGRSAFLQRTKSYANLVGLDSHSGQRFARLRDKCFTSYLLFPYNPWHVLLTSCRCPLICIFFCCFWTFNLPLLLPSVVILLSLFVHCMLALCAVCVCTTNRRLFALCITLCKSHASHLFGSFDLILQACTFNLLTVPTSAHLSVAGFMMQDFVF